MTARVIYRLEIAGSIEEFPGERVVRVRLAHGSIPPWTLGICMLNESVVDMLSIHSEDRSFKLHLERCAGETTGSIVVTSGSSAVTVALSSTELDRWVYFFLSYLRDGHAPVDHIDVDLDGSEPMTLVLHVPAEAAPVSPFRTSRR
ncbi:MAG TPA: hypothetical protein VLK84_10525 [Longimicrobium sp.]|nr:hypothetical protein [Longimicrobium sp.]